MGIPIVPAPNTGPSTHLSEADVAAMTGYVTATSGILGYTDNSVHSLNALVELVYVRIGNELMGQSLSRLEGALSATKQSLDALTTLQGLQNMIDVQSRSAIPFTFSAANQTITYTAPITTTATGLVPTTVLTSVTSILGLTTTSVSINGTITTVIGTATTTKAVSDAGSYMSAYNIVASAYYKPIDPFFSVSFPGNSTAVSITATNASQLTPLQLSAYNWYKNQLISSKAILSGLIAQLTPLTPPLPNGGVDPTTLLAKLKIVYGHLPVGNPPSNTTFSSVRAWILDGYAAHNSGATAKQGLFQQEITTAIVSGESLNSSQNAAVRRYMFIFEQYYQSATSIISSLNQLMNNIARKVSGG